MSIGKDFIKKTQHKYLGESLQSQGVPQPSIEMPYDENKTLIDLPKPDLNLNDLNLKSLIEKRQSLREYSEDKPLSLEELSYLLWCTQGVKKHISKDTDKGHVEVTFRPVPSGGARHPLETLLLINHVNGLKPGLYRYIALKHKLIEVEINDEIKHKVTEACANQEFIKTCAVTFIWVADIIRSSWRYQDRGYRYALLDAGHVCQNLYLTAEAIESGVCAIGSYDDDKLNELLGFDGENQFVIYAATVGKR